MPAAAEVMNVSIEALDAGGRGTMARPDDTGQEIRGPIAAALAGRLDGSARVIDVRGEAVGQRVDAPANERLGGGV